MRRTTRLFSQSSWLEIGIVCSMPVVMTGTAYFAWKLCVGAKMQLMQCTHNQPENWAKLFSGAAGEFPMQAIEGACRVRKP